MKLKIPFIILLLALASNTHAHALWIETNETGAIGEKHHVAIYYGEYAENERDSVSHWFSDVKESAIWLVSPANEKIQLTTTAEATRLVADFTPTVNGIYTLLVDHAVKDIPRTTLYQFVSSATVNVGNVVITSNDLHNTNSLSLSANTSYKRNKSATIHALFKNHASNEITFSVVAPTGWSKSFKADAAGDLVFTPIWDGMYYVEAFYTEKISGQQNGKTYESIWRGATYFITVGK